jgi:hypothetical protein
MILVLLPICNLPCIIFLSYWTIESIKVTIQVQEIKWKYNLFFYLSDNNLNLKYNYDHIIFYKRIGNFLLKGINYLTCSNGYEDGENHDETWKERHFRFS